MKLLEFKGQESIYDEQLKFNYNEIMETIEEKFQENKYIKKSNWQICGILLLISSICFSFSAFSNIPNYLQLLCLLSGITILLTFGIFFLKVLIENKMEHDILQLKEQLEHISEKNINVYAQEIYVKKIEQTIYGSYIINEYNQKYKILSPFIPDFISNHHIHVLIYESQIIDFFYL